MPAPTKYPDWATDGTNVVEPPAGKKAAGWVVSEQPPSGWFNWWQGIVGQWTRWFDTNVNNLLGRMTTAENNITAIDAHAVYTDEANTFIQGQIFDVKNASAPVLRSIATPNEVSSGSSNQWKLQFEWKLTDGTWVRLYTGDGGNGNWALTSNAVWDPYGAQSWSKDIVSQESNVLRCYDGELHWYGKAGGVSGSWGPTGWDTTRGVMRMGDDVHSGNGWVRGDFLYEPARTWTKGISPNQFRGANIFADDQCVLTPSQQATAVLRAPHSGTLGQVKLKVKANAGDVTMTVKLQRRSGVNFGNNSTPTITTVKALTNASVLASTGIQNITTGDGGGALSFGNLTVSKDETYEIFVINGNTSAGQLYIYAAEFSVSDPGPRNF